MEGIRDRSKPGGMDVQGRPSGTTICGISSDCMEGREGKNTATRFLSALFFFLLGHVLA